jgi:hypothetical protein
MDSIPGTNALATFHDVLGDMYVANPGWYNIATMPVAAAVTYNALLNTTISYGISAGVVGSHH